MSASAATTLRSVLEQITPTDAAAGREAQRELDRKTKPRGSLGELETLICRIASVRGTAKVGKLRTALVLAAGDHGVAAEGVSAYPQEVTRQMLANFAAEGAAVNILAREVDARLVVIDAGITTPTRHPAIRPLRLGAGTANFTEGPAMSRDRALDGLEAGVAITEELGTEFGLLAVGDMGIGNTTAASALCAALLPAAPEAVCGRGTGIDDAQLAHKIEVVQRGLERNRSDTADPVGALAALGGFEIAVLAGVCLGAAARSIPVVLDGFVTGAAALVAARLEPIAAESMIASHRSPEPGHALVLADLGLRPLFDLGLRLGEGSGAALALPIVHAALALLADMATFEAAGVTDAGA
jgi:nicotinate-nucleotide--dimethylbenzimidazole phosphoribosyltransferase